MADETAKESAEFGINKSYAQNYNRWRRKEELQKYKDRYGDYDEGDSSSSETEDEDAEGLTPKIEKDFFKTLSIIKSRDPKMYTKDAKFYESEDSDSEDGQPSLSRRPKGKKESSRKDKPMYLKDYERKIIVEKEGKFTDDVQDDDEMEDSAEERERAMSPSYAEEQQRLKDSFFSAVHDVADDDDEEDDGVILTMKKKSKSEEEEEEKKYIEWLKGEKDALGKDDADAEQLDPLRKYWTDPTLDDGEKFLRDFILNKGYIDKDTTGWDGFHMDDDDDDDDEMEGEEEEEEEDFSEEERQLEEQEDFERKYNFRYEEPDSDFIKRYPRTVAESVRRKDTSRAEKRQDKKARQEQEKQKKREELKHLKNLKKEEIMERINKLKEVTGNDTIGFDPDDLEGDFDPAEHDRLMQKVFSGEYEGQEEHVKPQFADEEEFEEENWDEWMRTNQDTGEAYDEDQEYPHYDEEYENDVEPRYDDADFNMDADYMDPSQRREQARWDLADEMIGVSRKKRKKMSMFAKSLVKKKPVFNPEDKSFEDYIEEYYRLDYEDMIGDLPCRFKYRNVPANDFGLTTDEILRSREKELNQWASLKKTCQYRSEEEEKRDIALFQKMGQNETKKKRVFLSLQEESDTEDTEDADDAQTRTKPESRQKDGRAQKGGHKPAESKSNSSSRKRPAGAGKERKVVQTEHKESLSYTPKGRRVQTTDKLSNGKNIPKLSGPSAGDIQRLDTEIKGGEHLMTQEVKAESSSSNAKCVLTSREKKRQRKREILAKLKGMKDRKKVKRLQGMRGRVKVGAGTVSEARLRAYGINPKKHRYRMKNEATKKK